MKTKIKRDETMHFRVPRSIKVQFQNLAECSDEHSLSDLILMAVERGYDDVKVYIKAKEKLKK